MTKLPHTTPGALWRVAWSPEPSHLPPGPSGAGGFLLRAERGKMNMEKALCAA